MRLEKPQNQDLETVRTKPNRYPLRGLTLEISDDFDEPMTDLWDVLGS